MTPWSLQIDGQEFQPIPESWAAVCEYRGPQHERLYAVSVAVDYQRDQLVVRYVHPPTGDVVRAATEYQRTESGDLLPAAGHRWPIACTWNCEPTDVARQEEEEYLEELHEAELPQDDEVDRGRGVAADGGSATIYTKATGNGNGEVVLHTDPDCPRLSCARKVHEHPRDAYADDHPVCSVCRGTVEPRGGNPDGPWQDLESMEPGDLVTDGGYDYEHEGDRKSDDRHANRALELARDGIYDEARREAGKLVHYQRSMDLLDRISEQWSNALRADGGREDAATPVKRLREARKQANLARKELDEGSDEWEHASSAAASARRALITLHNSEDAEGGDGQ
jgi:hypothetical protein